MHPMVDRFKDRKSECWVYPRISLYENGAWEGGPYLKFLDSEVKDDVPLRIYLHIPFCKQFCVFCPYYKEPYYALSGDERMAVLRAMASELELYAKRPQIGGRRLSAIYFGGGDPAILSIEEQSVLWRALRLHFRWGERVHISMEGTATSFLDRGKLLFFREQGVERTSFGIQTFDEPTRHQLNLRPTLKEIHEAIESIAKTGFPDTSVDMMYSLPGQDETTLRRDLHRVRTLPVRYIDIYSLRLYPNTEYMRRVLDGTYGSRPTPESEVRLCRIVHEEMDAAGYQQVSSVTFSGVAKEPHAGFDHTLRGDPTLAVGPSARSHIAGRNYRNYCCIEKYVAEVNAGRYPIEAASRFSLEELENCPFVFFPIRLRLARDVLGRVPRHLQTIEGLIDEGYVTKTGAGIELSREGRIWTGNIQRSFFSEAERNKERRLLFESLRRGTNPYNEDQMGTVLQRRNCCSGASAVPRHRDNRGSRAGRRRRL